MLASDNHSGTLWEATSSTRVAAHTQPIDSEGEFRALFDALDQGVCIIEVLFDGPQPTDYRFLQVNPAFEQQTGLKDAVGRTMRSFSPDHEEHWFEIYGKVALLGEPIRFENPAAALGRWFDVYAVRIGKPEQRRVAVIFSDISRRKHEDAMRALRAAETGHRIKNLLALVSGMIHLTKAETISAYREALCGRINALANSQRVLSDKRGLGADLASLVKDEMAVYQTDGETRVMWSGPAAWLDGPTAQSVAMALHELGTNAMKYGALSSARGLVRITWNHREDGQLRLLWSESGGPAVTPPQHNGLGTRIITRCTQNQFGAGEARFDWQADGLVCELVIAFGQQKSAAPA